MEDKIKELIQAELNKTDKYPQFHSNYEGYAVIMEKVEGLKEVVESMDMFREKLWDLICHSTLEDRQKNRAEHIKDYAIYAATEAIQVAAMAQKFIDMLEREETK